MKKISMWMVLEQMKHIVSGHCELPSLATCCTTEVGGWSICWDCEGEGILQCD
jgi:hypothetical protein